MQMEDGAAAKFNLPKGVAVDPAGNVYVADENNNRIRKITPTGTVTTLAGSTGGSTDGDVSVALFSGPRGITIDADGNLYISDTGTIGYARSPLQAWFLHWLAVHKELPMPTDLLPGLINQQALS